MRLSLGVGLLILLQVSACTSSPPQNANNICEIFQEKRSWYKHARRAENRWGTPVPILVAFTFQESSFRARARPPRKKIFGFIPGPRPTSAYGYVQALDATWGEYKTATGRPGADRNVFGDAIDFVGWYNHLSHRKTGIDKTDAYSLYLAYHEGRGGFVRRTYEKKDWLKAAARRVAQRGQRYTEQLRQCEKRLRRRFFFFF